MNKVTLIFSILVSLVANSVMAVSKPPVAANPAAPVATMTCHSEEHGTFQWFQRQGRALVTDAEGEVVTDLSGLAVGKTKRVGNMVVTYIVFADEDQTEVFGQIQVIGQVKQAVVLQETYICK